MCRSKLKSPNYTSIFPWSFPSNIELCLVKYFAQDAFRHPFPMPIIIVDVPVLGHLCNSDSCSHHLVVRLLQCTFQGLPLKAIGLLMGSKSLPQLHMVGSRQFAEVIALIINRLLEIIQCPGIKLFYKAWNPCSCRILSFQPNRSTVAHSP